MEGKCCGCKETKTVYTLRKGVTKCAECQCNQAGISFMNLFKKAIVKIPPPVHVLVAVSGGPSSMFAYNTLTTRIDVTRTSKTSFVKKIEAISTEDLQIPNLHHIDKFTVKNVADYAREHDFNCVVLGDNTDFIALKSMGCLSQGRPDLFYWISTDDFENYPGIPILRPARQILTAETEFICKHRGLEYKKDLSKLQKAFIVEERMIDTIIADGNEATTFAVQKMAERLPVPTLPFKCPQCGLPFDKEGCPCEICAAENRA
ncbi:hypothetical protein TVAG_294940 [Trichomonas vaginalis G3]|uniref:Uncharacterized protein n=1 Tax=Trichomonas vaginalis (strain ATCC PRA-98 / G3) TaxID=412133 RepID=A2DL51_TRIV3|nr:cytoplasmic tRNA 2-thiolation protein 2 family [Trichomonas vaginalis G3]EAY18842.1 hypothetical protein TVAG_294940 [Trichomonas vaginalis G3]KAI5526052.1 cytoplasmic tRNA 2-thiolation protein 2 family [Trichomonas vaginalis G3]|eukprot:XP_001579828.1 hypothetical protein [Trichomonas vaginalis G3]